MPWWTPEQKRISREVMIILRRIRKERGLSRNTVAVQMSNNGYPIHPSSYGGQETGTYAVKCIGQDFCKVAAIVHDLPLSSIISQKDLERLPQTAKRQRGRRS